MCLLLFTDGHYRNDSSEGFFSTCNILHWLIQYEDIKIFLVALIVNLLIFWKNRDFHSDMPLIWIAHFILSALFGHWGLPQRVTDNFTWCHLSWWSEESHSCTECGTQYIIRAGICSTNLSLKHIYKSQNLFLSTTPTPLTVVVALNIL